jgi:hypothetical protein
MSIGLIKKWEAAEGRMSIKDIKDRLEQEQNEFLEKGGE